MPTKLLIMAVSLNAVLGQLCLKKGLSTVGTPTALSTLPKFMVGAAGSPWIYAAVLIQGIGYILWMVVVTRVKLGVATASAGAAFYVLMALCGWAIFKEALTVLQWVGICLITAGVAFVSLGPL